jgi:hypothetical protein
MVREAAGTAEGAAGWAVATAQMASKGSRAKLTE